MSWIAAIKLAIKLAKTKTGEKWRRIWAQNSADELRRRQHEKEIDDILRDCGGGDV